jgi:hypothetical protein
MRGAIRLVGGLVGVALWAGGIALLVSDAKLVGALLVLLGAIAIVVSLTSHRGESVWDTVWGWLTSLP